MFPKTIAPTHFLGMFIFFAGLAVPPLPSHSPDPLQHVQLCRRAGWLGRARQGYELKWVCAICRAISVIQA